MSPFSALTAEDRWALAFHVGQLAYQPASGEEGRSIWMEDSHVRAFAPDLAAVTRLTPAELQRSLGATRARAVVAFLRTQDVTRSQPGSLLHVARTRLANARILFARGQPREAREEALESYLEGFEPHEQTLGARRPELLKTIEQDMLAFRAALGEGVPVAEVEKREQRLQELLQQAEEALGSAHKPVLSVFLGAFTILFREGLEALLIVVGMLAWLSKVEKPKFRVYVHAGWLLALGAGAATWFLATHLIRVSGASRETLEGAGSLLAACILLGVGVWLHDKRSAGAWQAYLRRHMNAALGTRTALVMFGLSFLAVYREVFETIIFYIALGGQGLSLAAGAACSILLLSVIGLAILRWSARLPLATMFSLSSFLLVGLAARSWSEKGFTPCKKRWVAIHPVALPLRSETLGVFPDQGSLLLQVSVLVIAAAAFYRGRHKEA